MAENDSSPRQYQPFPEHLKRLRRQGQVWQSRDLTSALVLAAGLGVLAYRLGPIADAFRTLIRTILDAVTDPATGKEAALALAAAPARDCLLACAPVLAAVLIAGILVPFFQVGPLLTLRTMELKLQNLNPASGLKRMFGADAWVGFIKTILKTAILIAVGWQVIRAGLPAALRLGERPIQAIGGAVVDILRPLLMRGVLVLVGFGLLDVLYQRLRYRQRTMISHQELKEQIKQYDQNPETRSRQRAAYQELVEGRMLLEAETGNAALLNPTEICCIVRFDPKKEGAPRLIAKGRGQLAKKLRQIARRKGMYMERNRPLARALFGLELRKEVPPALYEVAAEVLRWAEREMKARGENPPWSAAVDASRGVRA